MAYSRRERRVAPNARVTIRLNTTQRDFLLKSAETPANLGHALHRAHVRGGKLSIRVSRTELDRLILAAAKAEPPARKEERGVGPLLRYLESLEDRFEEPEEASLESNGETADSAPVER